VRRLLPALLLVLTSVLLFAVLARPDELAELRGDLLAALLYVMNWHLIASQQSYFDASLRPPLLQHLWSLAIEEQFYLLWPIAFGIGMRCLRRFGLLLAILGAAAVSVALMGALYDPGADPSRVYYGTDTRAATLLLGCALALIWSPWRAPTTASRRAGRALDLLGAGARRAAAVVRASVRLASAAVLRRLHADNADDAGCNRRRDASAGASAARSAGRGAAALDRRALLRHLPLALADLHADPPNDRCAAERLAALAATARCSRYNR
jgi:peptidoglycan/LPS O-acetylase OafA/YrhL